MSSEPGASLLDGDEQSLQVRQPGEVRDGHALRALTRGVQHPVEVEREEPVALHGMGPRGGRSA